MDAPTQFDVSQLSYFTGTTAHYRITRRDLLTDGTKYLADAAGAYLKLALQTGSCSSSLMCSGAGRR